MVTANRSHTTLKTGNRVSLKSLFIASTAKPSGGWGVKMLLPGQVHPMEFQGRTPHEVFNKLRFAVDANNITMSDETIWLNLNIAWMEKVDRKFWLLLRKDIASLIASDDNPTPAVPGQKLTPPNLWGSRAWNAMGLLLASENYSWPFFLSFLREILALTNPTTNPITGCQECFVEFSREFGKLESGSTLTRDEARDWLFTFHNNVNKRIGKLVLTRAQAWHENFWQ